MFSKEERKSKGLKKFVEEFKDGIEAEMDMAEIRGEENLYKILKWIHKKIG